MKLSKDTINVLKNYATINQSILVKKGSLLSTMSTQKNMLAEATVSEKFPKQFGIYDLNEFLATISLFEEPELTFNNDMVVIGDTNASTDYWYADPSLLIYPEKTIKLPSEDVKFTLTAEVYDKLRKAAGVMGLSDFVIRAVDGKITASVLDKRNSTSNTYSLNVGECDEDAAFNFYFLAERLKMIPNDYEVTISSTNISRFVSGELSYYVALESDSNE